MLRGCDCCCSEPALDCTRSQAVAVQGGDNICERFACHLGRSSNSDGDGDGDRLDGEQSLYMLPKLGVHKFSLHEDITYMFLSIVILLPAVVACIGARACRLCSTRV